MEIRLISLEIEQFKGIRHLEADFSEGTTTIYGDNATGKTTVYDALTWLLFGKDSAGRTAFAVKPVGAQAGVMPTVTGVLAFDGVPRRLKKCLREKWEKPRGAAQARYQGNTTDHFVDDVPYTESGYKQFIGGYLDDDRFRLLTSVHAVACDLPWRERRALLAAVCGLPDDRAILAGTPAFAALAEWCGPRTVEQYKAALLAERKQRNTTLNALPIRIDECDKRVRELAGTDFDQAARDKAVWDDRVAAARQALAQLDGGALLTAAQAGLRQCEAALRTLDAENAAHRAAQAVPVEDEGPALRDALARQDAALAALRDQIDRARTEVKQGEMRLDAYRAQWRAIDGETFQAQTCPTCGQRLPEGQLAQARARHEADKQRRKDSLLADSDLLKASVRDAQARADAWQADLTAQQAARDELAARLDAYMPPAAPVIADLPDYAARRADLNEQLRKTTEQIERIQADQQAERDRLCAQAAEAVRQADAAACVLAGRAQLDETRRRIDELTGEQRAAAAELEELDRRIALCEDFARHRVQSITDAVNGRFRLARFQLFRAQVNGGLADCCDVTVDGVPYADLNHAMQINVGLDIIRTLSAHYGLRVPVFVDNAEAVTKMEELDTQVVRLVVSEADEELRIV